MKKKLMALAGVVAVCMLLAIVSNVMAADANQPKHTPRETPKEESKDNKLVIGTVTVVKDNDGNITEIKVKAHRDIIYQVVLDEKGMDLGKTMNGKTARIEGLVVIKGDVSWLTVKTFTEPKAGTPAKPNQNPKAKPPAKPAPKPKD